MMAGKTAPASLMKFSSACMNGTCTGPDCLGVVGPDINVVQIKPYRSVPNIDLLCHTEVVQTTQQNEAEDVLRGIEPVRVDKQQSRLIPEIVVVGGSDENLSVVESCTQSQEPDIVRSTKSGSLPRQDVTQQLPQPIAPPRKKRFKTPSPLSTNTADEVCLSQFHIQGCTCIS